MNRCRDWRWMYCSSRIRQVHDTSAQSMPDERQALVPDLMTRAGQTIATKYQPYSYKSFALSGLTSSYRGSALNHQAFVLNPAMNGNRALASGGRFGRPRWFNVDPQAGWSTDGTTVNSCEEYAYKRYLSASQLEDAMAAYGNDYQAMMTAAFNASFPYAHYILDEQGHAPMTWQWPARVKNVYLTANPASMPYRVQTPTFEVLGAFANVGNPYVPSEYSLRYVADDILTRFGPDLLERRYKEQLEYKKLLAARQQLVNQMHCAGIVCRSQKPGWQAQINDIDAAINQALTKAVHDGCIDGQNLTSCDLSPHQLLDEMFSVIDAAREPDYRNCLNVTANDFSSAGLVGQAKAGGLGGIPGDYTASSQALHDLLPKIVESNKAALKELPADSSGRPVLGAEIHDTMTAGGEYLAATSPTRRAGSSRAPTTACARPT